jgi:hypothetical protein
MELTNGSAHSMRGQMYATSIARNQIADKLSVLADK